MLFLLNSLLRYSTVVFWKIKWYCKARMGWILVKNCQFPFSLKKIKALFLKCPVSCNSIVLETIYYDFFILLTGSYFNTIYLLISTWIFNSMNHEGEISWSFCSFVIWQLCFLWFFACEWLIMCIDGHSVNIKVNKSISDNLQRIRKPH